MPSATAKKAIAIFFLVFGLGLTLFIVTQGVDVYKGSRGYVTETSVPSVDCIKFFYSIGEINYELGELSFMIRNLDYSEDIQNITVNGRSLPVTLLKGSSQQIRLGAELQGNFTVYPGGCSVYSTTCYLGTRECVRAG